ncbi:MAG: nodulation protein NfeD [Ignavibacteriae bacterium]|nr:MAG: nodulation protein NfeD [Ignavibacteriota bacterium]
MQKHLIVFFTAVILLTLFTVPIYLNANKYQNNSLIYLIKIDGSINPATSDFIHRSIKEAVSKNAECLVIELNTPGGLLKSTRYIVSDLLTSEIPVIVYVSPSGSQAASAGVFIALASNIVVMAPGTNIGASHPVGMGGQPDSVMNEKATNDAAAFIRSISEKRNRNVQWAEDAVRKSVSISENEALNLNVIDLVANNINDMLQKVNGREVETSKGKHILNTSNTQIVEVEMSWFLKFLFILSDPNVGYILMMLGIWGIILEFYHPGAILPGVVGAICIILGLYGLHTLPLNFAGFGLILLAIILFIAEIKIVSYGMLSVAAVICLLIGSFMLIDPDSSLEGVKISMGVILTTVLTVTALFLLLIFLVIKAHKRKVETGKEGLIGEVGEVYQELTSSGEGVVKVHGEMWNALLAPGLDSVLPPGTKVKVVSLNNLKITVQKVL